MHAQKCVMIQRRSYVWWLEDSLQDAILSLMERKMHIDFNMFSKSSCFFLYKLKSYWFRRSLQIVSVCLLQLITLKKVKCKLEVPERFELRKRLHLSYLESGVMTGPESSSSWVTRSHFCAIIPNSLCPGSMSKRSRKEPVLQFSHIKGFRMRGFNHGILVSVQQWLQYRLGLGSQENARTNQ